MLRRNQLYAGIVDVPEYGVRAKRGAFEPLISEDLFNRVQAVLAGRVPSATPQQRAHPDFPLRAFVRCDFCGRGLTGSWSKGRGALRFEVPPGEGAARTGLEVALEAEGGFLIRELDGDVQLPWASHRRVWAATVVVVGEAGGNVVGEADVVVGFGIGAFENIDEALVCGHAKAKATAVPKRGNAERTETMKNRRTDGSL